VAYNYKNIFLKVIGNLNSSLSDERKKF